MGVKYVSQAELETILVEVESCINSRPLTFVSDESDFTHYLTPSHFILGRNVTSKSSINVKPHSVTSEDLCNRERMRNKRLEHFWEVWRKDYIANLSSVVKGFNQKCEIDVGSIVLVREDNMPRLQWPIGVVVNVYLGRDGLIRSDDVKTRKGVFNRSIQTLHDLEMNPQLGTDVRNLSQQLISDNVICDSAVNNYVADDEASVQGFEIEDETDVSAYTKRGRLVKRPHRLDL